MLDEDAPPLSRGRLARILALPANASGNRVRRAATKLLARLEKRLEAAPPGEREALEVEIANLVTSADYWSTLDAPPESRLDRAGLVGALLGALLMLALLVAYAAGFRVTRVGVEEGLAAQLEEPAELILDGRLADATLRILDEDREELLLKVPAEDARVELEPGRYALEVSREDCPDRWTRSVLFEPGATHRFEPVICVGEGSVTVRSNVSGDRLLIDGLDVGETGKTAHTVGVGDHDIRVEKQGYAAFEGRVRVQPDTAVEIRAELAVEGKESAAQKARAASNPMPSGGQAAAINPPVSGQQPEPFDMAGLRKDVGPRGAGAGRSRMFVRDGLDPMPDGGSSAWHDRVSRELVLRFDADGSGAIDQLAEAEAISCSFWQEIERDFDRGGLGLSMATYYGFDGSEWHPRALGFSREYRSMAYARMQECGLRT